MKAKIFTHKKLIGTSELRITDESMGVVSGKFIPNDNYKEIQKTVRAYNDPSVKSNDQDFYGLRLNAQLDNELFLNPVGGFIILDLDGIPENELVFEAAGNYRHVIVENFLKKPIQKSFLEPWEFISIDQKIAYEDELLKEIGKNRRNGLFKFLASKQHELCKYEFSAIAKLNFNDDVLFAIHKNAKDSFLYAVVHLTWKGDLESKSNFPITEYFKDFEMFLKNRMHQEKK